MSRIIYVGGGREIKESLEKAQALSIKILYIQSPDKCRSEIGNLAEEVSILDFENFSLLKEQVLNWNQKYEINGALSFSENALLPVAHICEWLNLKSNSVECVAILKNKNLMRERLNSRNFSVVKSTALQEERQIREYFDESEFPLIIKPTSGTGSLGIKKVSSLGDLSQAFKELKSLGVHNLIAEEFIDGDEFSVEAFSQNGEHQIIGITDKMTGENFVELGHSMPSKLPPDKQEEIRNFVSQFLSLIDFKHGPSHTELKTSSKGLKIIESHNRPGGDRISEMLKFSSDFDLKTEALKYFSDPQGTLTLNPNEKRKAIAIRFYNPFKGKIKKIEGVSNLRELSFVIESHFPKLENIIHQELSESYDRLGHVICEGISPEHAQACCLYALSKIKASYESLN